MSEIFQNANLAKIIEIVQELKNPKSLAKANANPIEFFAGYGIILPANEAYEIYLNDGEYYYFVLPQPSDMHMNDEQLRDIQAGANCKCTISCALCLSCFSCTAMATLLTLTTLASASTEAEYAKL